MSKFSLEIDTIGHTGYVAVNDHSCASTRALNPAINFDLDADGQLCGIEFLSLDGLNDISPQDFGPLLPAEDALAVQALIEESRMQQAQ